VPAGHPSTTGGLVYDRAGAMLTWCSTGTSRPPNTWPSPTIWTGTARSAGTRTAARRRATPTTRRTGWRARGLELQLRRRRAAPEQDDGLERRQLRQGRERGPAAAAARPEHAAQTWGGTAGSLGARVPRRPGRAPSQLRLPADEGWPDSST